MPKSPPKQARVGRPRSEVADSHAAIMDAVYSLLQETSVRDLTMEAVAKRAGVGKPTLYKWWQSKATLVLAMFHERLAREQNAQQTATVEATIRGKMRRLAVEFRGLFGKVMADLIAEGQSDHRLLHDLYNQHIRPRRAATIADIERGKTNGEFSADVNSEILVDEIVGPIYFRMLLRSEPLTQDYVDKLIDQTLRGLRQNDRSGRKFADRRTLTQRG
jgi:AcrR family transcriptional regulator